MVNPGLRSILADAGVPKPPILDWFSIAMRLQHAEQAASGLSTDEPGRVQAVHVTVANRLSERPTIVSTQLMIDVLAACGLALYNA